MDTVRQGTISATPNSSNGYNYVVATSDGDTVFIRPLGVTAKLGDAGNVRYVTWRNSSFFVWEPRNV